MVEVILESEIWLWSRWIILSPKLISDRPKMTKWDGDYLETGKKMVWRKRKIPKVTDMNSLKNICNWWDISINVLVSIDGKQTNICVYIHICTYISINLHVYIYILCLYIFQRKTCSSQICDKEGFDPKYADILTVCFPSAGEEV